MNSVCASPGDMALRWEAVVLHRNFGLGERQRREAGKQT